MRALPLPLGPMQSAPFQLCRSGIRWLVPDGHLCRPGEIVGFCNVGLLPTPLSKGLPVPFAEERRDFQACFAPRVGGRLRPMPNASQGGDLDQQHFNRPWNPDEVIATLEAPDGPLDDGAPALRLSFVAGRRFTELAEDRKGLLTGWHDRTRAWHGDAPGHATLLSLGICELNGVVRGDRQAFSELLEEVATPLHAIHVTDEALIPSAPVLLGQLSRTESDRAAIAAAISRELLSGGIVPTPADYMFAGAALAALTRSPLTDRVPLLTRAGLTESGPPDAVVLSLHSESSVVLRHRRLGFIANWHRFRVQAGGPAVREWLQTCFEPVRRSLYDIFADTRTLIDTLAQRTGARVLVMNVMSTSSHEDISSYAPFAGPLSDTLASVRAKEQNLMLHDLAEQSGIDIIDADAIAADLGGGTNLPDGVHQSRAMQDSLRAELLFVLGRDRRATANTETALRPSPPRVLLPLRPAWGGEGRGEVG